MTIWIILCGIISFISVFFSDKLVYPLNTLLSMFISLLIINKLINKLKSFKEKKEKIRIERIGILINILKINKIKEEKYEDLVMNIEKKVENYTNMEIKIYSIAKLIFLFCGFQIIIEGVKNLNKKDFNWFFQNKNSIEKLIEEYTYVLAGIVYGITLLIILWTIWKMIMFALKQMLGEKYISKEQFLEIKDLMQDIMLMDNSSNEVIN